MIVFKVFFCACLSFLIVFAVLAFLGMIQYLFFFYSKKCDKCGKFMSYKGCRRDSDGGYFLFRCKKCGNWEKISKRDFFRYGGKQPNTDKI